MCKQSRIIVRMLTVASVALAWTAFSGGAFPFGRSCLAQESILVASPRAQAAEKRIRAALREPVSLSYREKPLSEIADELSHRLGINVVLDVRSLNGTGIGLDTPVTIRLHNTTAESAFSMLLRLQDLDWMILEETLVITTKENAAATCSVRLYLVRDLVSTTQTEGFTEDADPLIDLITRTIAPQTWDELGGPGTLEYSARTGTLVVSQSRDVHDQIEQLLATLRQARAAQGIRPPVAETPTTALGDLSPALPPTRRYSAPQTWNQPLVHR